MRSEGFKKFTITTHTNLWQKLKAKDPAKGFGVVAFGNQWGWYETWLNRVREECQKQPALYGFIPPSRQVPVPNAVPI